MQASGAGMRSYEQSKQAEQAEEHSSKGARVYMNFVLDF